MNIITLRNEKKILQKDLACKLDISPQSYCDKEKGRRKFTALEIQKLCIIFNVSISDLNLEYNVRVTED